MALYRNFFNVSAMTMLSRVLGFVRDVLIAQVLGTSAAADAFFAAFRFPNLFRRLFAEGAFNAAFVPMFSGALEEQGETRARELAAHIISFLALILLALTVLVEIFAPVVLVPFVPGFLDDPAKFDLTVLLTRICFPYLACMSLMAAYGAILNTLGRFLVAAFAPVLLNVVLVTTLAALIILVSDFEQAALVLSFGVLVGGIAQLTLLAWAVSRLGHLPRFVFPRWDRTMSRFWKLAVPAMLTGGITQINIFVGTIIASGAASAISYLYYADRLYQLPLGIIGIAVGVVLLPELSRHLKASRIDDANKALDSSLFFALVFSVPAAVALAILAEPIIRVLFERGSFTADATAATVPALIAFSLGLPAFVAIKVFQPPYFAREDTVTPTLFAAISVVVNVGLSLILFPALQHVGIAIATAAAAWVNLAFLIGTLIARGHYQPRAEEMRRHALLTLAALLMGLCVFGLNWGLTMAGLTLSGFWGEFLALFLSVLTGLAVYFILLQTVGVITLRTLIQAVRR